MSSSLLAQKIAFVADCNASKVVLGNAFRLSFRLENAEIKKIRFPDFEAQGFQIVEGPSMRADTPILTATAIPLRPIPLVWPPMKRATIRLGPQK